MTIAARKKPKSKMKLELVDIYPANAVSVHLDVIKGLPFSMLSDFESYSGFSRREIAIAADIPLSTLARREKAGFLERNESDRLLRIIRVFNAAKALFNGRSESAHRWLQKPAIPFGGITPWEMLGTEVGGHQVERFIGQLEHGVYI